MYQQQGDVEHALTTFQQAEASFEIIGGSASSPISSTISAALPGPGASLLPQDAILRRA